MSIERPLESPNGLFSAGEGGEPDLEIEIVNPEAVSIETEDGGMIFEFNADTGVDGEIPHDANLAEYIEDREL